jgi:hypothetical protein
MKKYLATSSIVGDNSQWSIPIPKALLHKDPNKWYHLTAIAYDGVNNNTSQLSNMFHFEPMTQDYLVKNTLNEGDFSLRAALEQVNLTDVKCRVIFNIKPEDRSGTSNDIYRIQLDTKLAPVFSNLGFTMDGNTQKAFDINDELDSRIIIDGVNNNVDEEDFVLALTAESDVSLRSS